MFKNSGEMQPIEVKPEAFYRIGTDLVGSLPETKDGYKVPCYSSVCFY